ncbi:MAG: arylsulfotransferase family protein, partial [Bacteroidota bacterium]
NPIREFSQFPSLVMNVFKEVYKPERLLEVNVNFKSVNALDYDVFGANAFFKDQKWVVQLKNLRDDSIVHEWYLENENYLYTGRVFSHAEPRLPIILKDTGLIVYNDMSNNLYKLDSKSNIIWHNTQYQFHHSINLDHSGNIWTCTRKQVQVLDRNIEYFDDYVTSVDVETGKIIFHKSLTEVFMENGLEYLIHGQANSVSDLHYDPFHLNDVEPVLKDGPFWKQGDVFLSLRNRSALVLYRPSTNKIIRLIQGPFFNQHDIDILSDSTISLFNNNATSLVGIKVVKDSLAYDKVPGTTFNLTSEVLIYNFADSSFASVYPNHFLENKIFTRTQGLHQFLSNGDLFVESYHQGKVFIFNDEKLLLSRYYHDPVDGMVEYTHWVKIYEDLNFLTPN